MAGRLLHKIALVTGGTSGIGEATVRMFAKEGAKVAFTGRRKDKGLALQASVPGSLYIEADHTKYQDCERCLQETISTFGELNVLFNNAGVVLIKDAEHTSEEEWANVMSTNVTAVWRMSKLALPHMRDSLRHHVGPNGELPRGLCSIINNASDWALVGAPEAAAYCTSKGAVVSLTKAMALQLAKEGIRVNAVCPGDTFVNRWVEESAVNNHEDLLFDGEKGSIDNEEAARRLRDSEDIPMGRVAEVEEIVNAVLFLASSESSFVTGTTLAVDGGNTAQ